MNLEGEINSTPQPVGSPPPDTILHYKYDLLGRGVRLELDFDANESLDPTTVQTLLSESLHEVASALHHGGDRPVPGQRFIKDVQDPGGDWIHLGVWSIDEDTHIQLTYKYVEDTLRGLWEFMVNRRISLTAETETFNIRAGLVAFAFVSDLDYPQLRGKPANISDY